MIIRAAQGRQLRVDKPGTAAGDRRRPSASALAIWDGKIIAVSVVLIMFAAAIGLAGPGAWSLDHAAGIGWPSVSGIAARAIGILAGLLTGQ